MYNPNLGRFMQPDPIGFLAGDVNVYRFVSNGPPNATDPTGLIDYGTIGMERVDRQNKAREVLRGAFTRNNLDPRIADAIFAAMQDDAIGLGPNPCQRWAEKMLAKLSLTPRGEIVGAPGAFATIRAWTFTPALGNLYCIFVDAHFAIEIKLPNGEIFYFDDSDWGDHFSHMFRPKDIPGYAK